MAEGTTAFPYKTVRSSITVLQSEAPEGNELSVFSSGLDGLSSISEKHDDCLQTILQDCESGGSLYTSYSKSIEEYNKLISNASNAISKYEEAEENGGVELPGGSGGGGAGGGVGGGTGSGGYPGSSGVGGTQGGSTPQNRQTNPSVNPSLPDRSGNDGSSYPQNTPSGINIGDTTDPGSSPGAIGSGTTPSGLNVNPVAAGATGAGVAGAISGLSGEVGGKGAANGEGGSIFGDNPMGNYTPDSSSWNNLPTDVQNNIINKLKSLGYSDEQIQSIIDGNEPVPQVAIDALSDTLADAVAEHPEIRDLIKEQYGIDIFNEDGSVDKDKLAIALFMDEAKDNDGLDLVGLLHDKYNIDVVDSGLLTDMSNKLSEAFAKNNTIRNLIIQKYGFDIFNDDGSINKNKLVLALLMDKKSATDGYDLSQTILDLVGNGYSLDDIVSSVIRPNTNSNVKSGSFAALPLSIALGLGATASTVGGGVKYVKDKKKQEASKNEIKSEDEIEEAEFLESVKPKKAKNKDDMSWLLGLGLGIGAVAATKKAKDEIDKKKNEEQESKKEIKNKLEVTIKNQKKKDKDDDDLVMI